LSEKQHRLISNIGGAAVAAVVVGTVFYTFGYSGEQRVRDFVNEFMMAIISFGAAAFLVSRRVSRNSVPLDVVLVSLFGSLFDFVLKLIMLDGANGIPAYVSRAMNQLSIMPVLDLLLNGLSVTFLTSAISLPFVVAGIGLGRISRRLSWTRKAIS
jgi:hypothetical protein